MTQGSRARCAAAISLAVLVGACAGAPSAPAAPLPTQFVTASYQQGSRLYLQNAAAADTFRIAIDTAWGSSIVDLSWNASHYVNAHDTGREVQIAFYDGNARYDNCAGCTGVFGWNPVQAGDRYSHGAPTITVSRANDSLFAKVQPYQWNPDDKGGGPGRAVLADAIDEEIITPVPGHIAVFHVHWTLTHLGSDVHANSQQELPAVYATAAYDRFAYYGGTAPYTGGAVSYTKFGPAGSSNRPVYVPESWGAYVDDRNEGLLVYSPSQMPYATGFYHTGPDGPTGDGTNYFAPITPMTIGPGFAVRGDFYVIAGPLGDARAAVYDLHEHSSAVDIAAPFGATNAPAAGATLAGVSPVIGWAIDNGSVSQVQILIDGAVDGSATYGLPRPDVVKALPNPPLNIGFSYSLNTAKFPNGAHALAVRITDAAGNVAVLPDVAILIAN